MPDTPNYTSLKARFQQFPLVKLLDEPPIVQEPHRTTIKDAHDKIATYFNEDAFRQTLSITRRNTIESHITNALEQFNQIVAIREATPAQLDQNIESFSNNIQSYMEEIDIRFYQPFLTHTLQNGDDLGAAIKEVRESQRTVSEMKNETAETLKNAKLLTGEAGSRKLSDYYQMLATGRTSSDEDAHRDTVKSVDRKRVYIIFATLSGILLLGANEIIQVFEAFQSHDARAIIRTIGVLIAITGLLLPTVINRFNKYRPGGYDRSATIWAYVSVLSVVVTAVYAGLLVTRLGDNPGWEQIVPKLIGLLAPAYFVRFCVHNYRVNKHLMVANVHKAAVSVVSKGFANQIATQNETLRRDELLAQSSVLEKAAEVVFSPTETGYITSKEGAGNANESMFDGTPFNGRINP